MRERFNFCAEECLEYIIAKDEMNKNKKVER